MKPPRHLYDATNGLPLCGGPSSERAVHPSKARKDDCPRCRLMYRAEVKARRASSLRASARQTEFDATARRLLAEADKLDAQALKAGGGKACPYCGAGIEWWAGACLECNRQGRELVGGGGSFPPPDEPVVILSVRPPEAGPRRSYLVGEIRLAIEKFGGAALADLILADLQAPPSLPKERTR